MLGVKMPIVAIDDHGIRPAGKTDECFYCRSKVGEEHKADCVIVVKKVKLKATIYYETLVPHDWNEDGINFRYNEGGWCTDNIVNDLQEYIDYLSKNKIGCLCSDSGYGTNKIEYVETVDDTPTTKESLCSE